MKLSFAQLSRLFEAFDLNDNKQWEKVRKIAYEVWRHGSKNAPPIETYMPIGAEVAKDLTDEEVKKLNENWQKYKKLDRKVKRKKIFNVKARTQSGIHGR